MDVLCTLHSALSGFVQILYNPVSFAPFTPARLYYFSELGVTLKPCLGLVLRDALLRLCLDAVRRAGLSAIADPCLSRVIMAALCNRTGHYIFVLWFLLSIFLVSFPRLISAV